MKLFNVIIDKHGILARELPSNKRAPLAMGYINVPGGAVNIIPPKVYLEGTSRSLFKESAEHMSKRLPEIVEHIGKAFRAKTKFEVLANALALVNTPEMSELVKRSAKEVVRRKVYDYIYRTNFCI